MIVAGRLGLAHWAAGVAVVMAVGFLFAPSARAECGGYVIVGAHQNMQQPMGDHSMPATPHNSSHPDSPPNKRPCHGPLCSSAPGAPVQPAPGPSTTFEREPLSEILLLAGAERSDSISSLFGETGQRPVRRPSSIFHPPRPI